MNMNKAATDIENEVKISVFISLEATAEQQKTLETKLNNTQAQTGTKIETSQMMWVVLDTNADGMLSLPTNKGIPAEKLTNIDGDDVKIAGAAAAWLANDDGKVITSW